MRNVTIKGVSETVKGVGDVCGRTQSSALRVLREENKILISYSFILKIVMHSN